VKISLSTACFKDRMSSFFNAVLHRPLPEDMLRPRAKNKALSLCIEQPMGQESTDRNLTSYLSRTQQEYFLSVYWQLCHCTTPIIHENKVRERFDSLWSESSSGDAERQPCALVDIILAVSMQRAANFLPRDMGIHRTKREADTQDASVAGRSYFQRCQAAIIRDLEEPSLATLQCVVLSIVYLNNASLQNTAYQLLGLAARIAYALDADERLSSQLSVAEQELRRRIWWLLHTLDFEQFIDFGRPCAMERSRGKQYSDDCLEVAGLSRECSSPVKEVTSLSFFVQLSKLFDTARTVYTTYHKKLQKLDPSGPTKHIYEDARNLERCAAILPECLEPLRVWMENLPTGLQMRRKRNGKPFSTDGTPVDLESGLALWLQRNRLCLETFYHKIVTGLYSFFISFSQDRQSSTPLTKDCAVSCVNHAIAMTGIIHQVLIESDIINGWYDAYYLQWDATLSMLGFMFAHPSDPLTLAASRMLEVAISIFDILGTKFSPATRAADLTREMKSSAIHRIAQFDDSDPVKVFTTSAVPIQSFKGPSSSSCYDDGSTRSGHCQTQPCSFRSMPDSMVSSDGSGSATTAAKAAAEAGAAGSNANIEDPFMLDVNAFDPSWLVMTESDWFVEDHELQVGGDGSIHRTFQAQAGFGSEIEDTQIMT